jgi:sugar/nucleoside kinase (ribokinase family)
LPPTDRKTEKEWDVVVAGELYIDFILSGFLELPGMGQEGFARDLRREIGGGTAITACGLARLGLKVAVLGAVGEEDGDWILQRLNSAGVSASAVARHSAQSSGLTVAVSTSEDRAFFTYYGANESLPAIIADTSARSLMSSARHVHFAFPFEPISNRTLLNELKEAGSTTSLDVGWNETWLRNPQNLDGLQYLDLFFPNEREAELLTGESDRLDMLNAFQDRGARNIVLKLGARGAVSRIGRPQYRASPIPITPIDTTGAGDSFDAGYIYGLLKSESPETCLQIANICGALSTRKLGGIAGFPTLEELMSEVRRCD